MEKLLLFKIIKGLFFGGGAGAIFGYFDEEQKKKYKKIANVRISVILIYTAIGIFFWTMTYNGFNSSEGLFGYKVIDEVAQATYSTILTFGLLFVAPVFFDNEGREAVKKIIYKKLGLGNN